MLKRLRIATQTEWVASRISINGENAIAICTFLLKPPCTRSHEVLVRSVHIVDVEIEMNLLGSAIRPLRRLMVRGVSNRHFPAVLGGKAEPLMIAVHLGLDYFSPE